VAIETGRARRAGALTSHLHDISPKEYPALSKGRDIWMRPLPTQRVADGLWHLIRGFTSGPADPAR
jgi:hypothetical protein